MTLVYIRNQPETIGITFNGEAVVVDLLETPQSSTVATNLSELFGSTGYGQQNAMDFALLAIACYVADKQVRRRQAPDGWRRSFTIHAPVHQVDLWQQAAEALEAAIGFLTGDEWKFVFRHGHNHITATTPPFEWNEKPPCVTLFSGGLDSFIGTLDLLSHGLQPLLIGHFDTASTRQAQLRAYAALPKPTRSQSQLLTLRVAPRRATQGQEYPLPNQHQYEPTTRSRSLLFVALGLLAANAIGPLVPLYIPENGFISLNVPWSANRYGSCSTRSTHPFFLDALAHILQHIGLRNPLINPYQVQTKGQMAARCSNPVALRSGAKQTLSCSHPDVGRWIGLRAMNCGYCFPCLIRRAALHTIDCDDSSDYAFDVCSDVDLVVNAGKGATARAVLRGISRKTPPLVRLLTNGPLGRYTGDPLPLLEMYVAGVEEIKQWLAEKAHADILQFADLT